jgi:hypothetical protein
MRAPLALFVATLLALGVFKLWAPSHADTARDRLMARDCLYGGRCDRVGPGSSFTGLTHGELWPRAIELWERSGASVVVLERLVDVLIALAAMLLAWIARERAGPWLWALWLPATLFSIDYPTLGNMSPIPLVLVAFWGLVLRGLETRGVGWLLAASVPLGLARELHIVNLVLIPVFVLAAIASRRVVVAVLGLLVVLAIAWLDSPSALSINLRFAARHWIWIVLGLGATVAAGLRLPRERVVPVACLVLGIGMPIAGLVIGHHVAFRYFMPIVTPVVLLAAARLQARRKTGWAMAALALAFHIAAWGLARTLDVSLRLHESERLAADLYGRGLCFDAVARHLRGVNAWDLVATLAAMEPPAPRSCTDPGHDYLVSRGAPVDAYPPSVQLNGAQLCRGDACAPLVFPDWDLARTGWRTRIMPSLGSIAPGTRVSFHMPVVAPAGSAPRKIVAIHSMGALEWQVERKPDEVIFSTVARDNYPLWLPQFAELR